LPLLKFQPTYLPNCCSVFPFYLFFTATLLPT